MVAIVWALVRRYRVVLVPFYRWHERSSAERLEQLRFVLPVLRASNLLSKPRGASRSRTSRGEAVWSDSEQGLPAFPDFLPDRAGDDDVEAAWAALVRNASRLTGLG